jgi:hypothetical protein
MGTPDQYSPGIEEAVANVSALADGDEDDGAEPAVNIGLATDFYLSVDLADPALIPQYRRNIVAISEAIWHLAVLLGTVEENSPERYELLRSYSEWYLEIQHDEDVDDEDGGVVPPFQDSDITLVVVCGVDRFFHEELQRVVRSLYLPMQGVTKYFVYKPELVAEWEAKNPNIVVGGEQSRAPLSSIPPSHSRDPTADPAPNKHKRSRSGASDPTSSPLTKPRRPKRQHINQPIESDQGESSSLTEPETPPGDGQEASRSHQASHGGVVEGQDRNQERATGEQEENENGGVQGPGESGNGGVQEPEDERVRDDEDDSDANA